MYRYSISLFALLLFVLLLAGCSSAAPAPAVVGSSSAIAPTLAPQSTVPVLPQPASKATVPANPQPVQSPSSRTASYGGVSFVYASSLAQDVQVASQPAVVAGPDSPYWEGEPRSLQFNFVGYILPKTFHEPRIQVYPVAEYRASNPQAGQIIDALQNQLKGQKVAAGQPLPFLPPFNAMQGIRAGVKELKFKNGTGIAYLTQFDQYPAPINNNELIYTYQGLTSDGLYYISAILPISNPLLPADSKTPPSGDYMQYIAGVTQKLDSASPSSFSPDRASLDALIGSLTVHPTFAQTPAAVQPGSVSAQDTVVLPGACYREGLPSYVDQKVGFCFAYPQHFALDEMNPGQLAILGPALDSSADPLRASLTVEVRPAAGRTLPDLIMMYGVETGTPAETPLAAIALDGEPGKVFDPIKGRPNARVILVLHNGNVFILSFAPSLKDTPASAQTAVWKQGEKDMQALYGIVTASFGFLDAPRQVNANDTIGVPGSCLVQGKSLYLDAGNGYCEAIPARFTVDELTPGQRTIFGPARDKSPEPAQARGVVTSSPAQSGQSLSAAVDQALKEFSGMNIPPMARTEATIGGKPALVVDGVPGRLSSRVVFVLNSGKLYRIEFWPLEVQSVEKDVEELVQLVSSSFSFLPSTGN